MSLSLNISAISFSISSLLSAFIAWRAFLVWRKQEENQVGKAFFEALLFFSLYLGVRGIVSFLFVDFPVILTLVYILSHVFLGIAVAHMAKFGMLVFKPSLANSAFFVVLGLYASDVILNIFLPNQPYFNPDLNIIEWGSHKYVGIYHTLLLWLVFLWVFTLFVYKAFQNWQDFIIRTRCLLIAGGILVGIFVSIPRNIFKAPIFLLISDISLSLAFAIVLWGISFGEKREEVINKTKNVDKRS